MARYTFGEAIDDDDLLVIQGIEYHLQPIGMRVLRRVLNITRGKVNGTGGDVSNEITEERLNAAIDVVISSVRPDERDRLREHIEESVPPGLLVQIQTALVGAMSDLDPTPPASSSNGSSPDGQPSTATAPPAALIPSI